MATMAVSSPASVRKVRTRKVDNIECEQEELSIAQVAYYSKQEKEYEEMLKKIDSMLHNGAAIVDKANTSVLLQLPNSAASPVNLGSGTPAGRSLVSPMIPVSRQGSVLKQSLSTLQSPVRPTNSNPLSVTGSSYQLVMDPRLGLIVGTVAPANSPSTANSPAQGSVIAKTQTVPTPTTPKVSTQVTSGGLNQRVQNTYGKAIKTGPVPNKSTSNVRPTEANSTGSVAAAKNSPRGKTKTTAVVDLTSDEAVGSGKVITSSGGSNKGITSSGGSNKGITSSGGSVKGSTSGKGNYVPDSKEINFNKLTGKTFPSLVVVARPSLKIREMTPQAISQESSYLDGKVKSVLMYTATKFTEWLIQQGLVRSEQFCTTHVNPDMTPVKLKLGMYSDVSKFPYSGGYVWISDCCPQRFVSVFSGSIFEGAPHAPNILIKLMYHWSSQTNVQNISQWVKVDNLYVKSYFTNLRAICTAAIHEKFKKMGGSKKRVEVGVISLGTTTSDGSMRQVKIEVLGMMETDTKLVRLRAVEPLPDGEKNYKKRFAKILEPLEICVLRDSVIVTDFTVDKSTLYSMGYKEVVQVSSHDSGSTAPKFNNSNIMEYLRRVVPRMFQNTLSLLSRQIMQQFLDELVWRERWGYVPARAFDNIIAHLAEQTKLDTGDTLLSRLQKVAANPFKDWHYSYWKANCTTTENTTSQLQTSTLTATPSVTPSPNTAKRTQRKRTASDAQLPPLGPGTTPTSTAAPATQVTEPLSQGELLPLENYYYGSMSGDKDLLDLEKKGPLNMKCCVCRRALATNIQMMTHLIGHALNEGAYGMENSKMPRCKYCLRNFVSEYLLQSHIEETHLKTGNTLMCLICEEKFRDRTTLILHMHRNHHELELPYECGICGYRSSQHSAVVNHFYEVHENGEKVQCPYCLKIVAFANNGRKVTQNLYFFLIHIQKHRRKTIAKKCHKCVLSFVHKGIEKEHQFKDHMSFKGMPRAEILQNTGLDVIMMPKPLAQGPNVKSQLQKTKESLDDNSFTINKFEKMNIHGAPDGSKCCECEGEFLDEEHFPGYLSCLKCSFGTCCKKSMQEHIAVFHDPRYNKEFNLGKRIVLEKSMHCVCGFQSASGNRLANHLATCGRKSAYPSAERAEQCTLQSQSASFPPLVSLDDQETEGDPSDKWLQAFVSRKEKDKSQDSEKEKSEKPDSGAPPSMLDVLGLVRKQSTDEISSDKAPSDSENGLQESEKDKRPTSPPKDKEVEQSVDEGSKVLSVDQQDSASNGEVVNDKESESVTTVDEEEIVEESSSKTAENEESISEKMDVDGENDGEK